MFTLLMGLKLQRSPSNSSPDPQSRRTYWSHWKQEKWSLSLLSMIEALTLPCEWSAHISSPTLVWMSLAWDGVFAQFIPGQKLVWTQINTTPPPLFFCVVSTTGFQHTLGLMEVSYLIMGMCFQQRMMPNLTHRIRCLNRTFLFRIYHEIYMKPKVRQTADSSW